MAKKTKNKDYYKAGKFKSVQWSANVKNDTTKTVPTLVFTSNFYKTAYDLKSVKTKINKELNNVTKQINRIKKDSKTGALLKNALVKQLSAYETARKDFLDDIKKLYNGAINEFNEWMQSVYDQLAKSVLTYQGTAQTVKADNISAGDNDNTQ